MPHWTFGYIAAGLLLIAMALASALVKRLPVTSALLYLGVGVLLGPGVLGVIDADPLRSGHVWERLTEVGVLLSLFTAGLKLRVPLNDRLWLLPVRLASVSMVLTVAGIAVASRLWLHTDWGTAVLLGAILAPTDPVLASDVSVDSVGDRDRVRFSLTGEAGFNDGTAYPFAMLGLWMMGLRPETHGFAGWLGLDLLWAVVGGVAIGAAVGTAIGHLVLYLRRCHKTAVGLEEFLSLGVLALTYGLATVSHSGGFLAVFAAGLALRRVEAKTGDADPGKLVELDPVTQDEHAATDPDKAPAYLTQAVLGFNEQLERVYEAAVVVLLGGLLLRAYWYAELWWFVPLLFVVIRPAAVWLGTLGSDIKPRQRLLIGWFGVRGVGALYYLSLALNHGVPAGQAQWLIGLTLTTVTASVVVHGLSVTPLLTRYQKWTEA